MDLELDAPEYLGDDELRGVRVNWVTNAHEDALFDVDFVSRFMVGPPRATKDHSVDDLIAQGMIGAYIAVKA